MTGWWVQDVLQSSGPGFLAAWVLWVVFSICLHELGHGWAAIAKGDDTPIATGHMTWNPVVHMGVPGLVMFALVGITWGMMPVNPSRFRGRHADAFVAVAGPLMNLAIFLLCAAVAGVLLGVKGLSVTMGGGHAGAPIEAHLFMFANVGAFLNIALLLLNLLPFPPLDGSRILASFVRPYREFVYGERGALITLIGLVLVLFVFSRHVVAFAGDVALRLIVWIASLFTSGTLPTP